jgi:hypothetical protein
MEITARSRGLKLVGFPSHSPPTHRGFAFYVVDSRSPDALGRIPTDQCSPSTGFPARRIHPARSVDSRFAQRLTLSGLPIHLAPAGHARLIRSFPLGSPATSRA